MMVIESVTPSSKASDEPREILPVVQLEQAPLDRVAPEASMVICPPKASVSPPSVQPAVVGSLKSKSTLAESQTSVVADAAMLTDQPLSAASGLLTYICSEEVPKLPVTVWQLKSKAVEFMAKEGDGTETYEASVISTESVPAVIVWVKFEVLAAYR